jgi:hypothetical protein
MGEGERIDAFVAKDGVIQSKSYATLPSPVGRERVRVRVFGPQNPYHNHTSACFPGKELAARELKPRCREQTRRKVTTKYTNHTKDDTATHVLFFWDFRFGASVASTGRTDLISAFPALQLSCGLCDSWLTNVICGCGTSRAGSIRG